MDLPEINAPNSGAPPASRSVENRWSGIANLASTAAGAIGRSLVRAAEIAIQPSPIVTIESISSGANLVLQMYQMITMKPVAKLVINCSNMNEVSCRTKIADFVETYWLNYGLPACCNNDKNKRFLLEKLFLIIRDHSEQSIALRQEIAKNVIENFVNFISEAFKRVDADLKTNEFKQLFGVAENDQLIAFEIIGEETHNKGHSPMSIAINFSENLRVVYKPRSVISEYLICNNHDSLFKKLNLDTYKILDKGEYGYCEYLYNKEECNTFETHQ